MTEAARLVDELTTLLYTPFGTYRGRPQVACGACAKQADKPESVVHESDCPVYRLIRAEAANTAVIRANAEEIADLEDTRDELEARVNALTAEIEHKRKLFAALTDASFRRIDRLTVENKALREAGEALYELVSVARPGATGTNLQTAREWTALALWRAALAAAQDGEGQRGG